jgi:hypothetical protein
MGKNLRVHYTRERDHVRICSFLIVRIHFLAFQKELAQKLADKSDTEIVTMVQNGELQAHNLEKSLGDFHR